MGAAEAPVLRITSVSAASPLRETLFAVSIASVGVVCYLGYAWTAMVRLGLLDRTRETLVGVVAVAAVLAFGLLRPMATAVVMLLLVPFFGNHPGGRLMELINLPLAASAVGLTLSARAQRKPPPFDALWIAAALYVASAVVALVPAIPGMWVRAAQLNSWPVTLAEGLTAPEDNPLYSLSSVVGVSLAVVWAMAFVWRAPTWYRDIVRALIYMFFVIVGLGILDYVGVVSLVQSYMLVIDPRKPDVNGFQSVFWNPGWFAWYFVMLFGLTLGYLWTAHGRERRVVAVLLAIAYAFSFVNPQRGGLLALHICLVIAGMVALRQSRGSVLARGGTLAAAAALVAVVGAAYAFDFIPRSLQSSIFRLVEQPEEAAVSNSIRVRLWTVALRMWRDAPVFGIGEGSFGWRFTEYAPPDSDLYTTIHGDAHSTWMQTLATRGTCGLLALAALAWLIARTLRSTPESQPRGANDEQVPDKGLTLGLTLSFIGFLVYSAVQGMFYLQGLQILFWFLVGVSALSLRSPRLNIRPSHAAVAVALFVAVLIGQAVAARPLFVEAARTIERQPRGFYPQERSAAIERSWRWSAGHEGTLCLQPRLARGSVVLSAGDPRPSAYPRTVTLKVNGTVARRVTLSDGAAATVVVPMPIWDPGTAAPRAFGECTGQKNELKLTVEVDRTWSPLAEGIGGDPRTLGVQVFEPIWLEAE
jgi:hypothetical protein